MSEDKLDQFRKIPSGCPSPARAEKTDSSSSRQSGSPVHWDFESCLVSDPMNRTGRVRPSSWDDSDDDLSPKAETSGSKGSRIYSSESNVVRGSISSELNELKKQFFESLEKEKSNNDISRIENLRERLEMKFKCDRRQSPARIRRRSKSSSSSSPVADTKCQNSPEAKERANEVEEFDESEMSPKTSEQDSRYYLNNFFSELRSKRISMLDSFPVTEKAEKDGVLLCDNMKLEMLNELNTLEVNEDGGYFCKTSRKLSQILEVEENRKDFEKSSEESMVKPEKVSTDLKKVEGNDYSPLQTARSQKSEKVVENAIESTQKKREGYKSLSFEEFGNFITLSKSSRGSLSERSARIFERKIDDDFIHLCAKSGKTRLSSPQRAGGREAEKPFQFLCLTGALGPTEESPAEPTPRKKAMGMSSSECLKIDLNKTAVSESPTPRKSTDRSDQSHTSRTKSGKSRSGSNPQSPKFMLSIEGDSERSMRADDVNTPDSRTKEKESKIGVESRMSSEECSGKKSNKSSCRSEGTYDSKTERNLHIALNSPSVESLKSTSRSFSEQGMTGNNSRSGRSSRRSERKKDLSLKPESKEHNAGFEKVESSSPVGSIGSLKKVKNISNRSESSGKSLKSPKIPEDAIINYVTVRETPRSQDIPELDLSLQISERPESQKMSCRSKTATELHSAVKDPDRILSERNFSSRSRRSGRSKRSTARSTKRSVTPRPSGSNSVRSRGSLDLEKPRVPAFEAVYDALSNQIPVSPSSRGSSWREIDVPSPQASCRSEKFEETPENSGTRKTFTPKPKETLEDRLLSSRKSSVRSVDSCEKTTISGSFGNISPSKSERIKSRPSSWTSEERKFTDIPPDVEKLDIGAISGRSTNRSFISEEDEDKEENLSSHGSRTGTESDRHSNKRLSIINEASIEDFDVNNVSIEKEEKDIWEMPRPPTRRDSKRVSPRSTEGDKTSKSSPRAPSGSFRNKPWSGSPSSKQNNPDGGTWTELIETFKGSSDSFFFSEKTFPGFFCQKEEHSVSLSMCSPTKEAFGKFHDDDDNNESQEVSFLPKKPAESKTGTPKSEINRISERATDQQHEEDFNFSLVSKEPLIEKMKREEEKSFRSSQNLYYVDVKEQGHYGMGECGDMSCWSAGKSDTQDPDKPQDHGDGISAFKSSEVLMLKPEKKEKETKTHRQLWTELKEDFRDSRRFSNDPFPVIASNVDFTRYIPIGLKKSKSDNCINRKLHDGSECLSSATCEFLSECKRENVGRKLRRSSRERNMNFASKDTLEHFSSGSVDSPKEEFGATEFDCERTPRLSRSMSDLQAELKTERYESKDLKNTPNSSRAHFEELDFSKEEKESVNLSIFLARKKEEETMLKSNNWLSLKSRETNKSGKRGKKGKNKLTKSSSSSGEHLVQYLSSRKSRSSVPSLKLRNSNCFQSFYKRFISVFCVTSNSSAATSK